MVAAPLPVSKPVIQVMVFEGGTLVAVYRSHTWPENNANGVRRFQRADTNKYVQLQGGLILIEEVDPDSPMPVPQAGVRLGDPGQKKR